jgi:pyrimidine-nucleoside phosphorylase
MRPQEIIAIKRDGGELSADAIDAFIGGVVDGSWADYQTTALIMAMFVRGLNLSEQDAITRAMLYSGEVMDLSDIDLPKADKHSTGGVGDKTSLMIAPLAAACGLAVPMISGRGLGHTGGTLDKLESIKGYNVHLSADELERIVKKCGFAMAGQTANIAPADKKIYALRDATATVPYIPLIVASIMSKKLAEGLDALVLDVKTGSGAFMAEFDDSVRLAEALCATGEAFGVRTQALITDMSQPLGQFVGNSHEVYECIKILRGETGETSAATRELSLELTARMLVLSGIADDIETAREKVVAKLESGDALEKFRENIILQNGDASVCDHPESLIDDSLAGFDIIAGEAGYIANVDALTVGESVVTLGGGRTKAEDGIDHCVGFECVAKVGDSVAKGDVLGRIFCREKEQAAAVETRLKNAFTITDNQPEPFTLIHRTIG